MIERTDPHTGEVFYARRTNQRFASRKSQVAYNNAKAKELRDQMTEIDNQIRKNWQIISEIVDVEGKVEKSKDYLLGCGYNFNFFNNQRLENGNRYFGIYGFGLRRLGKDTYELIKFTDNE